MKCTQLVVGILCVLILASCDGGSMTEKAPLLETLDAVPKDKLKNLLNSRLFFGHQSVGYNIIEGISNVLGARGGSSIAIIETRDPARTVGPGFFHSPIGQNTDPLAKIRDFDAIMRSGNAANLDIAFMKLCYVDVQADTDVTAIFRSYKNTMARLKEDFPHTVFVHFTVPLVSREKGIKPLVKGLLGRQIRGYGDNSTREQLNTLLRNEYEGEEAFFDIARFESTRADGSRTAYEASAGRYYALEEVYTSDGGHLNQEGERYIAEQLIVFLSSIVR